MAIPLYTVNIKYQQCLNCDNLLLEKDQAFLNKDWSKYNELKEKYNQLKHYAACPTCKYRTWHNCNIDRLISGLNQNFDNWVWAHIKKKNGEYVKSIYNDSKIITK